MTDQPTEAAREPLFPPLPEPQLHGYIKKPEGTMTALGFTADQMHAYLIADRAARALTQGDLSAFDQAIAAELPRVSTLEYNSHEICKLFAKNVRERLAAAPSALVASPVTQAARDVLAERQRQIGAEGWTAKHDDKHHTGSMALAAACYACNAATWASRGSTPPDSEYTKFASPGFRWPWAMKWWKPKGQRQDLVRAGALILAEIERLDRASLAAIPVAAKVQP